jgi:serine protease inhibitor
MARGLAGLGSTSDAQQKARTSTRRYSSHRVQPARFGGRADRPFLYAFVHQPTGLVLFTGHVADPGR